MRWASSLSLFCALVVVPARSQQPVGAAQPPVSATKAVRRVMAPPSSATVQGTASRSTAQTMNAHADVPLAQVPVFAVTDPAGKAVNIGSLRSSGHWLLLYRSERCPGCDAVMAALARSESPLFKQGTSYVIVVKGSSASPQSGMLDKLKATYPTLSNATWVEDINGEGFAALKPHGEPVLYAVSGNDIAWVQHGTLQNPAALERLASSWLASTSKPRPVIASSTSASATATRTGAKTTASHPH